MGKIIVSNIMSLDGNYEGPGKNVMMLPMDGAFDAYNLERMKQADVILLGETSYKLFSSFWPGMASSAEASSTHREFSALYNKIKKVVVSENLTESDLPEVWKDTTRIISSDVYKEIEMLKNDTEKDIVMYASHILWNNLLSEKLVDELHFVIGNVILGTGTPAFENTIAYDYPKLGLELKSVQKCENSNNLVTVYSVVYK
jgi:dihydrofolate reductase